MQMENSDAESLHLQRLRQQKLTQLFLGATETQYRFCLRCLHMMCERDLEYHKCRARRRTDSTYREMENIIQYCKSRYVRTTTLAACFLRCTLGRDIMKKICVLVSYSQEDLCLWYQARSLRIKVKPKTRKHMKFDLKFELKDKFSLYT